MVIYLNFLQSKIVSLGNIWIDKGKAPGLISLKKITITEMIPDFLISKYSLSKFIFAYSTNELP